MILLSGVGTAALTMPRCRASGKIGAFTVRESETRHVLRAATLSRALHPDLSKVR